MSWICLLHYDKSPGLEKILDKIYHKLILLDKGDCAKDHDEQYINISVYNCERPLQIVPIRVHCVFVDM